MPSSTSSSDGSAMVWRSLLVAALLIGGYEALIRQGKVPPGDGISQAMGNQVRVERYAYEPHGPDEIVLVGSSLMANLEKPVREGNSANLAQAGGSSLTGVCLVNKLGSMPNLVVVEISGLILRGLDEAAVQSVSGLPGGVARNFALTRKTYSLPNVLLSRFKGKKDLARGGFVQSKPRTQRIAQLQREESLPFDKGTTAKLHSILEQTRIEVDALVKRGTKVVLVWIPRDTEVEGSVQDREVMSLAKATFPEPEFPWIWPPKQTYLTNDAIHLIPPQARAFRDGMLSQAKRLAGL